MEYIDVKLKLKCDVTVDGDRTCYRFYYVEASDNLEAVTEDLNQEDCDSEALER